MNRLLVDQLLECIELLQAATGNPDYAERPASETLNAKLLMKLTAVLELAIGH